MSNEAKVPCLKCQAEILPTTAKKTGGYCRPCGDIVNSQQREAIIKQQLSKLCSSEEDLEYVDAFAEFVANTLNENDFRTRTTSLPEPAPLSVVASILREYLLYFPDVQEQSEIHRSHLLALKNMLVNLKEDLGDDEAADRAEILLLSKLGDFTEAIRLALSTYEKRPGWDSAVDAGNALRRSGDTEGAISMFEAARQHNPSDVSALLEIGDLRLESSQFEAALSAYEEVLRQRSQHEWALPSMYFCRYRLSGADEWLQKLRGLAHEQHSGCECALEETLKALSGGYSHNQSAARAQYLYAKFLENH